MKNIIYLAYLIPVAFIVFNLIHGKIDCETKVLAAAQSSVQDAYLGKNEAEQKNKEAEESCQKTANKAEFLSKLFSF